METDHQLNKWLIFVNLCFINKQLYFVIVISLMLPFQTWLGQCVLCSRMKLLDCTCTLLFSTQNQAIQRMDNSILRVNLYLMDSTVGFDDTYPLKGNLLFDSIICPMNNSDINWFFSRWVWTKHTLLFTWP